DNSGTIRAETNTLFLRTDARHDDATLTADAGATLSFDLGAHTFAGTTTGAPEGEVLVDAAIEAEAGAVWDLAGAGVQWQEGFLTAGTLTNEGLVVLNGVNFNTRGVSGAATAFVNAGTVRWEQEEFTLSDAATWTNTGTLTVDAEAASVTLRRAGLAGESFDNAGIVSVDTGRLDVNTAFDHAAGALIQGNDTFDIRGSAFTQDGDTGPGTSPGLLTWQDDWAPSSGSTLFIEVGGSVPGTDYDQLAADGAATLAGTLDLSVAVGDAPGVGDTFTVLTAADGVTGTFDTVVPAFGYTFDVSYNANDVEVEVLTVPNFDLVAVNTDPTGDPVVVAKPGAIDFSYVVTNNTAAPITGDVFFTASLGATTLAQGVILSGTLPANASSPVLGFTQGIPGFAPVGSYTYSLKIGQFPNTVVGQVDFTVVVTASGARVAQGEGAWSLSGATPWLGADGAVLMGAAGAEQAPTTPEAASSAVPEAFGLAAAYPNPFRSQTTLALDVPEAGRVAVAVYDALGRRVAVLLNEEVEAATHRVAWDASGLPSGVYLVRATGAGQAAMQRVTLVR
ncbi:MAG: T9SS type A sorting domain-containing protein, partial [Bacteroidota bacterium]